jgi:hypothetical protein
LFDYIPTVQNIQTNNPSNDYYIYFEPDIKLEQAGFRNNIISAKGVYHYGILGDIGIVLEGSHISTDIDKYRNYINLSAYINLFIF